MDGGTLRLHRKTGENERVNRCIRAERGCSEPSQSETMLDVKRIRRNRGRRVENKTRRLTRKEEITTINRRRIAQ